MTGNTSGREFSDLEAARRSAVKTAREVMAEHVLTGVLDLSLRIDIADENGVLLDSVSYADALRIIPAPKVN